MKKKLVALLAVLIFATIQFTTLSAAAPTINAKATDPTIDGIINDAEYSLAYTMDASNCSQWTVAEETAPTVNYYFAWSDKGLYVAVKSANLAAKDTVQINVNPNKLVATGGYGLFLAFTPNADGTVKVLRHNYQPISVTPNTDGKPLGFDITTKVTTKVIISSGITLEAFIPIAELQVKSVVKQVAPNVLDASALTIKANDTWGIGTYAITSTGSAWTSLFGAGVLSGQVLNKAFLVQSLGTITFLAAGVEATAAPIIVASPTAVAGAATATPAPTAINEIPKDSNTTMMYIIVGIVVVAAIGGILFITLRKKK